MTLMMNKDNIRESILSHVNDASYALYYHDKFGPTFGDNDFDMFVAEGDDSNEYDCCWCMPNCYEKKIRNPVDFSIED
uniref:Uncharacterized protein n=1 Tax=Rhizophagus irregularis (strain DAOM 181602 / DAOM 197198 / MUCL 43194) TaxID=747089 RepID=U9TV14_RHIID